MYTNIYIYIYIYIYMCINIYIYIYTYIHTYMHACMHTYIHTVFHEPAPHKRSGLVSVVGKIKPYTEHFHPLGDEPAEFQTRVRKTRSPKKMTIVKTSSVKPEPISSCTSPSPS